MLEDLPVEKFPLSKHHADAAITGTLIYSPSSDVLHRKGLKYLSEPPRSIRQTP